VRQAPLTATLARVGAFQHAVGAHHEPRAVALEHPPDPD
jgi:hypothetical protein